MCLCVCVCVCVSCGEVFVRLTERGFTSAAVIRKRKKGSGLRSRSGGEEI